MKHRPRERAAMPKHKLSLGAISLAAALASLPAGASDTAPLDSASLREIDGLYHRLIHAENRHDLAAVRPFLWESPSTLFVAKTATAAEGNWAGFWGTDVVMQHLHDLYQGTFVMAPDYARVKTVGLTA